MIFRCTVHDPSAARAIGGYLGPRLTSTGLVFAQGSPTSKELDVDPAMLVDLGVLDESDGWVLGGDLGGAHCSPDAGQVFASLVDSEMPEQSDEDLAMKLVELGAAAVVRSPEFDPLRLVGFATPQARPGAFGYSDLVVLGAEYAGRVELDRLLWTEVRWVAGGVVLRTLLDHEALESLRNAFQRILVSPIGPALLSRQGIDLSW